MSEKPVYIEVDPDERRAWVTGARNSGEVARYLPDNYKVVGHRFPDGPSGRIVVLIGGKDVAGWTLDDYVIPRLASGWLFATEVFVVQEMATTPCPECGENRARGDESLIVYCGACGEEWHVGDAGYPDSFVPFTPSILEGS